MIPTSFKKKGSATVASVLAPTLVALLVAIPAQATAGPVTEVGPNLIKSTISAAANVGTKVSTHLTAGSTAISAGKDTRDILEDYVLKPLALALGRAAIKSITTSTVNWINGGFQGSPAFATDLKKNLRQVADGVAQNFLTELSNSSSIHSPFIDSLVTNIGTAYYLYSSRDALAAQLKDTLSESSRDAAAFRAGDFQQGGWNAYWSTYMNPANNPFGAQMIASQALAERITTTINQRTQELAWGSGFMSWRGDCLDKPNTSAHTGNVGTGATSGSAQGSVGSQGTGSVGSTNSAGGLSAAERAALAPSTPSSHSLSDAEGCLEREIVTPGSYILNKANVSTDSPLRQLELAQSIDAIVGALAQQLISQALGGANGLRGASKPSQGGGAAPVTATNSTTQSAIIETQEGLAISMQSSISQVSAWKSDSQTIVNAALSAKSVCTNNPQTLNETVEPALATAQAAIVKANSLLATLNDLVAKLQDGTAYQIVSSGYEQLQDASALPSAAVMSQASADAKDSGTSPVQSLFTQLSTLASNGCQVTSFTERVIDSGL